MKALARLQPAQGIAAMQSINLAAVTPAFMTALFGSATAEAAGRWTRYVAEWTRWNHVRTDASLAAAAIFTFGLQMGDSAAQLHVAPARTPFV
jgi:uncharacterized membrane protein